MKVNDIFPRFTEEAQRPAVERQERSRASERNTALESEATKVMFDNSGSDDAEARAKRVAELKEKYNSGKLSYDSEKVAAKVYEELM